MDFDYFQRSVARRALRESFVRRRRVNEAMSVQQRQRPREPL